ncbi:MAG: hydratase [Verrucomicrobia bacterium]|nr:hydratase [Verrucomicrobiota bacterium]
MSKGKKIAPVDVEAIAFEAFAKLNTGGQIAPFSSRFSSFNLEDAYRVSAAVRQMRETHGEVAVGRKIGFTNQTIWAEYGVHAPMWGFVYDRTVHDLADLGETFSLVGLAEPRIEPEIIFGLSVAPDSGMDQRTLLTCIDWVAHGFEIVQSIFPGWQFSAPDTVAAFGLHGALLIGPRYPIAADTQEWSRTLASFEIDLQRDGTVLDQGRAKNLLGGPVSALGHLIEILARDQVNPSLAAGEVVTTGTLTRAFPIAPGQAWATELAGVSLGGISIRFV